MLVLSLAALLLQPGALTPPAASAPPSERTAPSPAEPSPDELEAVTITGRRPDPTAPRPVPIKHASIAPDGDRLAYVVEGRAGEQVVVQSLTGPVLATIEAGVQKVRRIDWAGEHHLVLSLSLGERGLPQAVGYDLRDRSFSVFLARTPSKTIDGGPPLRGRPNQSVASPMLSGPVTGLRGGEPVSFVEALTVLGRNSFRFDLYRVDLETGVSKVHAEGGRVTDQYAVTPDGRVLARSDYNRRTKRWRLLAYQKPGWREVLVREDEDSPPRVLGVGRDGASVLVRLGEQAGDELIEVAVDGRAAASISIGGDLRAAHFARDDGRLIALAPEGSAAEHRMFEPRLEQAWPGVLEAFEGQEVRLASWTPDYRKLVVRAEGPADSAAYHLVDLTASTARRLRPALPDEGASPPNRPPPSRAGTAEPS